MRPRAESEWLQWNDPLEMLGFLGNRASRRKRQLFALAGYEQAGDLLDEWGQRGLATLRYAAENEVWLGAEGAFDEAWSNVDNALANRFWQHGTKSGHICRDEDLWDAVEQGTASALTDWNDAGAVVAGATFVVTSEAVNDGYVRSLYGIHPPLRTGQIAAS